MKIQTTVREMHTTVVPVAWAGLAVHVVDEQFGSLRGSYELIRVDDREYVGIDIAEQCVAWCRANRPRPRHEYWAGDFIQTKWPRRFDLVFSQGTIDTTYDMDAFLRSAAAASQRWLYITAYRGFFPGLTEHRYSWSPEHGCFYNDLSPLQAYRTLQQAGCRDIAIVPSHTGRADIPFETLIVARVADA